MVVGLFRRVGLWWSGCLGVRRGGVWRGLLGVVLEVKVLLRGRGRLMGLGSQVDLIRFKQANRIRSCPVCHGQLINIITYEVKLYATVGTMYNVQVKHQPKTSYFRFITNSSRSRPDLSTGTANLDPSVNDLPASISLTFASNPTLNLRSRQAIVTPP